jgi:hypothetical protein
MHCSTIIPKSSPDVPATVGAGVGGIAVGLLAGAFAILVFRRCRRSGNRNVHREDLMRDSQHGPGNSPTREMQATGAAANMASGGLEYIVEPFAAPRGTPSSPPSDPGDPLLQGGNMTSPTIMSRTGDAMSTSGVSEPADRRGTRNVYVVHHDGGSAPVTVFTDQDAEVVELPPRYVPGSSNAPSEAPSGSSRETRKRRA